jgi:hypothetical protein
VTQVKTFLFVGGPKEGRWVNVWGMGSVGVVPEAGDEVVQLLVGEPGILNLLVRRDLGRLLDIVVFVVAVVVGGRMVAHAVHAVRLLHNLGQLPGFDAGVAAAVEVDVQTLEDTGRLVDAAASIVDVVGIEARTERVSFSTGSFRTTRTVLSVSKMLLKRTV